MRISVIIALLAISGLSGVLAAVGPANGESGAPLALTYRIAERYPHNAETFTQGLVLQNGVLYESGGLYGHSSLSRIEPRSGVVLTRVDAPKHLFAEGIALVGDRIVQLTWRAGLALIYDRDSLRELDRKRYAGEGWGLAFDGRRLVMSDGSATLFFRDPETFAERRRVTVRRGESEQDRLNELEWIDGRVWANIWREDRIVVIDPNNGRIVAELDLSAIAAGERRHAESALNGIAYDSSNERVLITGKNWRNTYALEIDTAPLSASNFRD